MDAVFRSVFQARACSTLAFRAVARSATHRQRARRPAPWPRARTGARKATLPWRGGASGGERGAAAATAAAAARRRGATPMGGAVTPPRSAPAHGQDGAWAGEWDRPPRDGAPQTAPVDGVSNRRRATATEAGAQARSPAGHRARVGPRQSLRAGRWGGQQPSGPCDPCGGAALLSHVTLFTFSVIATLATLTRPQIPEDTNADCHL